MAREPERCHEAAKWMRANYGKHVLAPLTGTDWRVFRALVHVWDLWAYGDAELALAAARPLLLAMQVSTRWLGVALVPFSADWHHEDQVRDRLSDIEGVEAPRRAVNAPQ